MANIDSIQSVDTLQLTRSRSLYSQKSTGRIHRGHSLSKGAPSIPSKYQTVVVRNNEKKGFGSCAGRFDATQRNENPGPAQYNAPSSIVIEDNASFSTKGLGGFVSKVKHFPGQKSTTIVGPGHYDPKIEMQKYFNQAGCTSNFHKPIATKRDSKFATPGPNSYKIPSKFDGISSPIDAHAAFLSKTKRELITAKASSSVPSPCAYNISDYLTKSKPRCAVAPFRSKTSRDLHTESKAVPGPGTYHPFEEVILPERTRLPRKHYLCISAPAAQMPPEPPLPGPGQYDLVQYEDPDTEHASSSVFLSTTNRWNADKRKDSNNAPGPASYNPGRIGKRSFIYNADKKWI